MDDHPTELVIPPGEARAVMLAAGDVLDIIDVEGKQVADLVAFSATDPETEWLSPTHTRSSLGRLKLQEGDNVLTNHRRPILRLFRDDVGVHDMSFAMCDGERYRLDYGLSGHPNCREAMTLALAPHSIPSHRIPDPINIFQNSTIGPDGGIDTKEPLSRAGDAASFAAVEPALVIVSACPQDQNPCNGWSPSPIKARRSSNGTSTT